MNKIDDLLLDEVSRQAQSSLRLRMNHKRYTFYDDGNEHKGGKLVDIGKKAIIIWWTMKK